MSKHFGTLQPGDSLEIKGPIVKVSKRPNTQLTKRKKHSVVVVVVLVEPAEECICFSVFVCLSCQRTYLYSFLSPICPSISL